MAWPEVSIEDFPPERDDESASLRQDILDELTDHFVCALNRELLKNPDEQTAKQRVLNQFGDPVKIARQLWLDAMKERIMSQRIMTGISAVMAVCSIAVVGIAWMLMRDSQGVNQKMLAQLAAIADRPQTDTTVVESLQRSNEAIVQELKSISERQQSRPSQGMGAIPMSSSNTKEMNPIIFRLVQETKDGKPAVGFTGKLTKSGTQTDTFSVNAVSNDSGKLDFGTLPWGKYKLKVTAPWGESYFQADVTTIPGRGYTQTLICPAAALEKVPVQFQVDWPDKLKSEDWVLLCDFRLSESQFQLNQPRGVARKHATHIWFSPQGSMKVAGQPLVFIIDNKDEVGLCPLSKSMNELGAYKDVDLETLVKKPSINLIEGNGYRLPLINLIPKKDVGQLSRIDLNQSFSVLNHTRTMLVSLVPAERFNLDYVMSLHGPTTLLLPFNDLAPRSDLVDPKALNPLPKTANGIALSKQLRFSALKDQKNVWKIKLPDLEKLKVPVGIKEL